MHARHRAPGNVYRSTSTSMSMGLPPARISPEASLRGHGGGLYASEYCNFNRPPGGFGRGQGQGYVKSFQPPRRLGSGVGDIFMEAGRLAAEYLVSQGLLAPSALSGKPQNGTALKKELAEFQEFRGLEADGLQFSRRRLSDEFSPTGLRNQVKGRRRVSNSYAFDWDGRDYGRSESFQDSSARASSDMESDNNSKNNVSIDNDQVAVSEGVGDDLNKFNPPTFTQKSEIAGDSEPELIKYPVHQDVDLMGASSSDVGKDIPHKNSCDLGKSNFETGEVKDRISNGETGKQSVENFSVQNKSVENDASDEGETDLLAFTRLIKVPTKIRSSLTFKCSKKESIANVAEDKPSNIDPQRKDGLVIESLDDSSFDDVPNKTLNSEVSKSLSTEDSDIVEELYPKYGSEEGKCLRSQSLPRNDQQSIQEFSVLGRRNSMFVESGQKRASEESDMRQAMKKPREWISSVVRDEGSSFPMSNLGEKKVSLEGARVSPPKEVILSVDHENPLKNFQFSKAGGEQSVVLYPHEKQLFPNSFKICDLNLMEASDMRGPERHENNQLLGFPSISETEQEAGSVHIYLSMSNNKHLAVSKEIEIIDLENDSTPEEKSFDNSERKEKTIYNNLEGFPNHAQSSGDTTDAQDGYRLMISELLGSDFPNCSSVPGEINSMQTEMTLHNGEGALADDDSIYMSLEEIPLTFMPGWEHHPPQEYGKPF